MQAPDACWLSNSPCFDYLLIILLYYGVPAPWTVLTAHVVVTHHKQTSLLSDVTSWICSG